MRGKNSTVNKCVFSCSLGKKNREITRGERWFVFFSVLLCNRIMRFIYALCEFFFLAVKFHLLRLGTGKWWNKYINKCINKKEARVFCGNWFSILFFFFSYAPDRLMIYRFSGTTDQFSATAFLLLPMPDTQRLFTFAQIRQHHEVVEIAFNRRKKYSLDSLRFAWTRGPGGLDTRRIFHTE